MATMQRHDSLVQSTTGAVIPGASVQINVKSSGAPATIYSDEGTTPITNPITTGSDGSFFFYAADDDYTIAATYGGTTYTLGDVTLHSPPAWRQLVYKTSDETVNQAGTGDTLQDDDDLEFDVLTGETWDFEIAISYTTPAAADFKFKLNGPAGTGYHMLVFYESSVTVSQSGLFAVGTTVSVTAAGTVAGKLAFIRGFFAATASGTMNFQWAQNTANAGDTKVLTGSHLIARKVLLA